MKGNLILETKINNKSLRLDESFDPKFYSCGIFRFFWNREESVKNMQDNLITLKSLIERTKKGLYTITYITASIDF